MEKPDFQHPTVIEGTALFVSDAHLGTSSGVDSLTREKMLVDMLRQHRDSLKHVFLLGDMFDFWFEYKDVVPKGYFKLFNILSELHENGTEIYYFTGNHDMWVQDYFTRSFGCKVFYQQQVFDINGKRCVIGHGDGIGGKQRRYLFIKHVFAFKPNRVLYSMLHPRQAFAIAKFFSRKSRASHDESLFTFQGEREFQVQYARKLLETEPVDCFIYGHRHTPAELALSDSSHFFNIGDWLNHFSYLLFPSDGSEPSLQYYEP